MKNKIKRTLTALCAALMLMGGFSVTAFAQTPENDATNDTGVVVEETEDTPPLTPDGNATLVDDYGGNSRLEAGQTDGAWLPMPATTEQLHEAMRNIGVTADNPQDLFVGGFANTEQCPFDVPLSVIQSGSIDELNYLGKLLEMQRDEDKAKFAAAVTLGEYAGNLKDLINLAQNLDCYWIYPTVQNEEDYGYYLIDELDELELPEEAKRYFMYEEYGRDAAINDGGRFTEQGYIYNNKNTFSEWYNGRESDIPKEYRIMSYPQPERGETERADFDAAATMPPAADPQQPRPVVPIVLTAEKPADKVKEITDRLEQGVQAIFDSDRYKEFLTAMSKFHDYSLNNTILIAMQGGNLVKGFRQWEKEFDRHVKSGEKGIKIFAPAPYKVKKLVDKIDPETRTPILDREGKTVKEEKEITVPAFKVVTVFDISQTEGKEFPGLSVKPLLADVEQYEDFFAALEKASPVPIAFEQITNGANGYFSLTDKRIAIKEGVSELQAVKTAIHEIAHAKLHDVDLNAPPEEQNRVDRHTREVQAESVAYTVCQHFGLDTSDYSFGYVAGWSSGKEMTELKASLETIQATAKELINEIEGHFTELQQKRQAEQEQGDTFSIYQLKRGDETRDLRFEPYDRLQAAGQAVDRANYELIYTAPLAPDTSLEDIYTRFNIDHPADFKGHSLSVSDIVVLHRDGRDAAHYVDSIGYREVPEFFKEQGRQLTPDELETGETVKTPRGTFYVTAMSREQMEVAGYGLHHQSEDGKYLIMGNGTRAFAIPAEQPEKVNPLKHIEDTVEQNDNAFDGLINNTPQTLTAGELEQKAKAGEPISLADYAAAIKAEKERGGAKQEKPSIRAQLRAEKERAAQKKTAKAKNHELEV